MNYAKRACALFLALFMLICLTACGEEEARPIGKYSNNIKFTSEESGIVAENDRFTMMWDKECACIRVTDKNDGYVWSTVPNDFYNGTEAGSRADALLKSPISINYIASPNNTLKSLNGSNVLEEGHMSVKTVENGLRVIYFFDTISISVPVIYKLNDDSFSITVDPAGVLEGDNKLYQVLIAPFLVSTPATDDKSSYLFVPSGSGALIYTDERDGSERKYSEEVYGKDLAIFSDVAGQSSYGATMPVYGVTRDDHSLLAVISEGAASCDISASAGDSTVGYANVCAAFSVRGSNVELVDKVTGGTNRVSSYSDGMINGKCTVSFYPLSGEDSGYSGMARCYRNYLLKNGMKSKIATSPLYIQLIGGIMTERSFAGIPYNALETATTIAQAESIISDIAKTAGVTPVVQLKGFGDSGLSVGKIGGGFRINSNIGKFSDISALQKLCSVYFDYDIVRYKSSGNGFSTFSDCAKAENGAVAYRYIYATAMGERDESASRYRLLARNQLGRAEKKAVKITVKNNISGISFSTLASSVYSDYKSPSYYAKGAFDTDVSGLLSDAAGSLSVMTESAGAYAAAVSEHCIAAPDTNSEFSSLDLSVPFYNIVFKGSTSLSVESVNLATQPHIQLLRAAETGSGLLYTFTDHYSENFGHLDSTLAGSVYEDNRTAMSADFSKMSEYLAAVSDSAIYSHSILSDGVVQTNFENGVTTVVNYNKTDVQTVYGTVEAEGFIFQK